MIAYVLTYLPLLIVTDSPAMAVNINKAVQSAIDKTKAKTK